MTFITADSLSDAYMDMLRDTLKGPPSVVQVTLVKRPLVRGNLHQDGFFRETLDEYTFPDGRTGAWWIEGRVRAMMDMNGEYWDPIRRDRQLLYVISALKGMTAGTMPRWNANRLIITLFDAKKDLHKARAPTPPCLITLGFYPIRQTLTLVATFRAQYTDAKGYGNLWSLAMFFRKVCMMTGFTSLNLWSIANKAILRYPKSIGKSLLIKLLSTKRGR